MMVGEGLFRCPRCGEAKAMTDDNYFFSKKTGRVTGYCKPCHRAWWRDYWATASEGLRRRARASSRNWARRRNGTRPENYIAKYRHEGAA